MKPKNLNVQWTATIAGLLRGVLYAPDGKPPEGWTIQQDLRIAMVGTARWGVTDWEAVIRGLRLLYPTGKLTLKMISARSTQKGWPLLNRALNAYYQNQKRKPAHGLTKLGISYTRPAA